MSLGDVVEAVYDVADVMMLFSYFPADKNTRRFAEW
jgi:hypothetical protein